MQSRLLCVKGCAATAAPLHVATAAAAPDRSDFPAGVGVGHDHPSALGVYEVANKVVGELVARIGHRQGFRRPVDPGK